MTIRRSVAHACLPSLPAALAVDAVRRAARDADEEPPAGPLTGQAPEGFRRSAAAEECAAVLATCHRPRPRGRGVESDQVALERGRVDAVIPVNTAAGLTWDGTAGLTWDGTAGLTWDGTAGLTWDGTAGLTWDGTAGLTWDGTAGLTWDGTAGLTWDGTAGLTWITWLRLNNDVRYGARYGATITTAANAPCTRLVQSTK